MIPMCLGINCSDIFLENGAAKSLIRHNQRYEETSNSTEDLATDNRKRPTEDPDNGMIRHGLQKMYVNMFKEIKVMMSEFGKQFKTIQ